MENKLDKERIAAIKSMSNSERMEKFKTLGAGLSHEGLQFFTDFLDVKSDELLTLKSENADLKKQLVQNGSLVNAPMSGSGMPPLLAAIQKGISENFQLFDGLATKKQGTDLFSVKAMTSAGSISGGSGYASAYPNEIPRPYAPSHFSDLLGVIQSPTGNLSYMRENVPLGTGSFGFTAENTAKPSLDYDFTLVSLTLDYLAGISKCSRNILTDLPQLQSFLSHSLHEDFENALDRRFYISLLGSTPQMGSSSETIPAAKALDLIAPVWGSGRLVSHLAVSPSSWTAILKSKPDNAAYSIPGGIQFGNGQIQIAGVPVVVINSLDQIAPGTCIAGNFTRAAAVARTDNGFSIRTTDSDSDDFQKNLITFRGESRCGVAVMQPKAFAVTTIS
jgi:HK97 family phage major capsid protein